MSEKLDPEKVYALFMELAERGELPVAGDYRSRFPEDLEPHPHQHPEQVVAAYWQRAHHCCDADECANEVIAALHEAGYRVVPGSYMRELIMNAAPPRGRRRGKS